MKTKIFKNINELKALIKKSINGDEYIDFEGYDVICEFDSGEFDTDLEGVSLINAGDITILITYKLYKLENGEKKWLQSFEHRKSAESELFFIVGGVAKPKNYVFQFNKDTLQDEILDILLNELNGKLDFEALKKWQGKLERDLHALKVSLRNESGNTNFFYNSQTKEVIFEEGDWSYHDEATGTTWFIEKH